MKNLVWLKIAGVLMVLIGALFALVGLGSTHIYTSMRLTEIVFGIINISFGIQLFKGKSWAFFPTLILSIIVVLLCITMFLTGGLELFPFIAVGRGAGRDPVTIFLFLFYLAMLITVASRYFAKSNME